MSYTSTPEQRISMWITDVRRKLKDGDVDAALTFLDTLECDWEKYQRGELEPVTVHTGSKMFETFENRNA